MKKYFKIFGIVILTMLVVSCAGLQTAQQKMETMVISYENIGMLAFPFAKAYIDQREANGSLSGEALIDVQRKYNAAVDKFDLAIDISNKIVLGEPIPPGQSLQAVLIEIAKMLADLTGGQATQKTLTMPAVQAK